MIPFDLAREHHAAVDDAARSSSSWSAQLWECLTTGANKDPRQDSLAETIPEEYLAMVRQDEVAAAYAFARLWPAFKSGKIGYDLRQMFRNGWEAFGQQAKTADTLAEGFGWDRSAAWQNYREIVGCSGLDTAAVTRIAKLAARMYAAIRGGSKRTVFGIPAEICDVERGADLAKLVGGEFAMLASGGTLEMVEFLRLATRTATIFATKGEEETSKGPLVIMIDESGSMHGQRHEWAAAAMIALSRVAADEHRKVAVVHFSTSCVVQELDAGKPEDVHKLITSHLSGGTDIARALRTGLDKVQEWRKAGALADAILITDGVDGGHDVQMPDGSAVNSIDLAVDNMVKECRLWTVAIDCEIPKGNSLREKAAEYIHLRGQDLTAEAVIPLAKAAL